MKSIGKIFLTGVFTVLPVVATIYLVIWVVTRVEGFLGRQLKLLIPEQHYHPGMGLAAAIVIIFVVGLLMRAWIFRQLIRLGEATLLRVPVVKVVYKALKDLFGMFSADQAGEILQVVSVQYPGSQMKLLGFVTRSDFSDLPPGTAGADHVAVYLPMSYQIGGYTVLLPRDQVTPIGMAREQAMRFVLTAGMTSAAGSRSGTD
jgi:uncharacterized membrane protein